MRWTQQGAEPVSLSQSHILGSKVRDNRAACEYYIKSHEVYLIKNGKGMTTVRSVHVGVRVHRSLSLEFTFEPIIAITRQGRDNPFLCVSQLPYHRPCIQPWQVRRTQAAPSLL